MTRKRRIVLPMQPHHVILRGNNRRRLFSFPDDYEMFLFQLGRAVDGFDCQVHALTLMSNHAHLIVTPAESDGLGDLVHSFAQRYAQYRNRSRDGSGKLFEERFRSFPILTELQLAITTVYIHMNPVRGGLVRDPVDYRWSTDRFHKASALRSPIPRSLWTPSCWYRSLGRNVRERARAYLECERDYVARSAVPERVDEIQILEAASERYRHRLLRPNGLSARESAGDYDRPKIISNVED